MLICKTKLKYLKKRFNKKSLPFIIVICFFTLSYPQSLADQGFNEETNAYGFITTYITTGNYTLIDQINSKTRNMINDLLQEKIQVYWAVKNFTISITKIYSEFNESKFFERGSFIIPFTGNLTDDNKIISIIYDYNQTSEIEINNSFPVPIYILLEQISVQAYPLNNVRIAQTYSRVTSGGFLFLQLTTKCGFLNYNILKDEDVYENLKLENYNVMFHPGGIFDNFHYLSHMMYEDIFYNKSDGIRSFVNNGGGYIGSCGGLTKASSGFRFYPFPISINLKRRVYNSNLRSIGICAIADIILQGSVELENPVQIKIKKSSSPITYGLDEIVLDSWYVGPQVYKTGENVEVIADYYNTGTNYDGTPVWLTAKFGSGKIVTFSTHPEISGVPHRVFNESMLNVGATVVSNSLYYTTADEKIQFNTCFSKNLDYIYEIFKKTSNLTEKICEIEKIFNPIREKIDNTKNDIKYLTADGH